jgi:hypothetical protein
LKKKKNCKTQYFQIKFFQMWKKKSLKKIYVIKKIVRKCF